MRHGFRKKLRSRIKVGDLLLFGRGANVVRGRVKWFNRAAGYGFIQPEGSDQPIFVSRSAVEAAGLADLEPGQTVKFKIVLLPGKYVAEDLKFD
jgi:CspA family cold shock protein